MIYLAASILQQQDSILPVAKLLINISGIDIDGEHMLYTTALCLWVIHLHKDNCYNSYHDVKRNLRKILNTCLLMSVSSHIFTRKVKVTFL